MDISVIVAIYGVEKYIERSLISLFSQTKTDGVEFILVNDCTKDRSFEIAKEVIGRYPLLNVVLIDKEKNGGVAAARQSGLDAATGTYTIHFDPDDLCESNMLDDLYNYAIERKADIVVSDFYDNYLNKELYREQPITENNGLACAKLLLEDRIHGSLWCKLVKRSLFSDNDLTFISGINFCEDKLIVTKLFCCTDRISYLPKAYLHYMQNSGSMVNSPSEESRISFLRVIDEMEIFFKDRGLFEQLNESLNHSKVAVKIFSLISSTSKDEQGKFASIFPEATSTILKYNKYNLSWRIGTYCASNGFLPIFNLIRNLVGIIKKLIGYNISKFK